MDEQTDDSATAPPGASSCVVRERWIDRIAIVSVSGVVDMLTASQLEAGINGALAKDPAAIVVDFTDVDFLASAGMGVLVTAHDKATPGVTFSVVADGPATSRPLKLVGITEIVKLYSTLDGALAACAE